MKSASKKKKTIHVVAGPTASGKSAKAMELASALNGVIVNCDSKQIYDDLPILTAQPSAEDKGNFPHKLYGERHPNDVCSAGNWQEIARGIIEEILEEGRTPIICGGTGLYIKALVDGFSPIPDIPQEVRDRANALHKELGNPAFHEELQKRDPVMTQRFHPYHTARLIRAWEVIEATGKSLAQWQEEPPLKPPEHWVFEMHKIMPDREILRARCQTRFLEMIDMGALEEVEAFQKRMDSGDVRADVPLTRACGLRQLQSYIRGDVAKEDAIERAVIETRQYAKRQVSWFRNQL